jgi:hypothetical protein
MVDSHEMQNLIFLSLLDTYTNGEFVVTPEMVEKYDKDRYIEAHTDYEGNTVTLKVKRWSDK